MPRNFFSFTRHFFIFLFSIIIFSSCTPGNKEATNVTEKGCVHTDLDRKFKGTPCYTAKSFDNGYNWSLEIKQSGVFMAPKSTKLLEIEKAAKFVAKRMCSKNNLPLNKSNFLEANFITKASLEGSFSCGKGGVVEKTLSDTYFPSGTIFSKCKTSKKNDDVAILVGNGNYETYNNGSIPNLIPAYANLDSMEDYVLNCLGIKNENLIILKDATLAMMRTYFGTETNPYGQLSNSISDSNQKIFVYFVGHGAPDSPPPIGDGSSYLIPVDAQDLSIANSAYSTKTFYNNLSKIPAKNITILVDTCFSGRSNNESRFGLPNSSPLFTLEEDIPVSYSNLTIMTAGSSNEIASWTKNKNHTLLTKYFIRGSNEIKVFNGKDNENFTQEFINFVQQNVKKDAKIIYGRNQIPQIINKNQIR